MAQGSARTHHKATDRLLARALTAGGLIAFVLVLAGSIMLSLHAPYAGAVLRAGVLALMSTPVLRVALAVVAFWIERDYKYTAIAFAVLVIVVMGAILRVAI
ncbi:MAG: hypothetical protein NVS9B15_10970 [Acidobacteriaceae bacterium]